MKKIPSILVLVALVTSAYAGEASLNSNDERILGKELFKKKSCTMCHKKDLEGYGPSLTKIAFEYSGKEKQLYDYLQGKSEAIIRPKKATIMKGQLLKLEILSDHKIKAITRYIITISDREF